MGYTRNPDLDVSRNGITMSILVVRGGRLEALLEDPNSNKRDDTRWVFGDWMGVDGVLPEGMTFDPIRRGHMCGTVDEGKAFVAMCKELGIRIGHEGHFVPLSNGKQVEFTRERSQGDSRSTFHDFPQYDKVRCRIDLPTREQLIEALGDEA